MKQRCKKIILLYCLIYRPGASIGFNHASNNWIMKTVSKRVSSEIEYLRALARMYEHDNNQTAQQATEAAIAALRKLVEIVDHPAGNSSGGFTAAA